MQLLDSPETRTGLIERSLDDEIVVLDRGRGRIHYFNRTAGFIWRRCDGQNSLADIARQMAWAFGVDVRVLTRDVMAAARNFEAAGLLEPTS